jgi:hypothetical protein
VNLNNVEPERIESLMNFGRKLYEDDYSKCDPTFGTKMMKLLQRNI